MSIEFENAVLAGVTLIREAIQSQNFVSGVAGWQIAADGSAEFVGMILRGTGTEVLVVGPDDGPQVVIGTDPGGTSGHVEFPTNRPTADHPAAILSVVQNAGLGTESASLLVEGPSVNGNTDRISVALDSQASDGSTQATFRMVLNDLQTLALVDPDSVNLYRRTLVAAPASGNTSLTVSGASGHTGLLLDVLAGGVSALIVDGDGDTALSGRLDVTGDTDVTGHLDVGGGIQTPGHIHGGSLEIDTTNFQPYVPIVGGAGSATFASRTGYYTRTVDGLIYFTAEILLASAGSGSAEVTVTAPTDIDRTVQQIMPVTCRSVVVSTMGSNGTAVALSTGSGPVWDQIVVSTDAASNRDLALKGSMLLASARITMSGCYRPA